MDAFFREPDPERSAKIPSGSRRFPPRGRPSAENCPEGRLQVLENLSESQGNTNVMGITVRSNKLRENINPNWVLSRPNVKARRWLQGPIHGVFAYCPGGAGEVNGGLLRCRKMIAFEGFKLSTPSNLAGFWRD
jgi:hypothetical protein